MNFIAIVDKKWGIAKDGKQIITIPDDMRHFQELTIGGTIIMGRKTYETIGYALPGRINVVFSKDYKFNPYDAIVCSNVQHAINILGESNNLWVIGGQSIYQQLLPYCDKAYITYVFKDFDADQFICNLDVSPEWNLTYSGPNKKFNLIRYHFCEYRRV